MTYTGMLIAVTLTDTEVGMFQKAGAEFSHHLNEYGQSESQRRSTRTLI